MLPNKLYHATFRQFLDSIKATGLGGVSKTNWTDSKPGIVYLASDPWIAESYAEEAEFLEDAENAEEFLDNIVILEVDTSKLDTSKLYTDENVLLYHKEEAATWEYHKVIPWEFCKIYSADIVEEFNLVNNLWTG